MVSMLLFSTLMEMAHPLKLLGSVHAFLQVVKGFLMSYTQHKLACILDGNFPEMKAVVQYLDFNYISMMAIMVTLN